MVYHSVKLDLNTTGLNLISIEEDNIAKFILLLPELGSIGFIRSLRNNSYYIIDSEWNELYEHICIGINFDRQVVCMIRI